MGATRLITKKYREKALYILQENIGQPVQNLAAILGVDKSTCTKLIIGWLREQGYNIISLHNGYMLQDHRPNEARLLAVMAELKSETVQLKSMVAEMMQLQSATVVPVPESVPEAVISDKPCVKSKSLQLGKPVDHADLIVAIADIYKQDRPLTKTGRPNSDGIHARRMELPAPYNLIGRDRLERIISELLNAEDIGQDERGFLFVPSS